MYNFGMNVKYRTVPGLGMYGGVVHLHDMLLKLVVEGKKNIYLSKTHEN
jgi:hypothetical protein